MGLISMWFLRYWWWIGIQPCATHESRQFSKLFIVDAPKLT
jgi:hypothetical protein